MHPERELASRRAAALQHTLAVALLHRGSVTRTVAGLGFTTVDQWRAAAHATETTLRRRVETGVARHGTIAWAAITDWPRDTNELQRTAHQLTQRTTPARTTAEG